MGTVWKAEDPLLGRLVAIKLLPDSVTGSPDARIRFEREARATCLLDHPNIATVYDAGALGDALWIAITLVDGETVSQILAQRRIPLGEACRIARDVAAALAHAHSRGVVHRDVTSRNIMIAADGRVMVIDFGLALRKGTGRITSSHVAMGTAAYISPEVANGYPADHRSDLYGLGVVLYEMATGELPFKGERPLALLYSAVNEQPEAPGEKGVPPGLEQVILTAMVKDPTGRYQSAQDFLEALHDCEEEVSRPPNAGESPPRPRKKLAGTRSGQVRSHGRPAGPSVAVLPFHSLSLDPDGDPAGESYARGVADILSASLSRIPGLVVIPPASAQRAPTILTDLKKAARFLGAGLVLSGTVRRSNDRLRLGFALTDPVSGTQLAGENMDGMVSNLADLEDQLIAQVSRSLQLQSASGMAGAVVREGRLRAPAHKEFVEALGHLQRFEDSASIDRAIEMLERRHADEGDTAIIQSTLGRACT